VEKPAISTLFPMGVSFQAKQSMWTVTDTLSRLRRSISSQPKTGRILTFTIQIVSFVGSDMIQGYESRHLTKIRSA
jgi:hypothetical protein